jgi:6-phosphogluconolactonase (cycloisomerase 2 family)
MNNRQSHTVVELLLTLLLSSPILVHGVTITPVPGSPFTTPNGQFTGLAYSPNVKWLACANSYDEVPYPLYSVSIYAVASNGVITQIPGSPFPTNGSVPECVAYSPDNLFLVAGNHGDKPSTISLFSVNQSTGALTQLDPTTGSPSTNTLPTEGQLLETIYYSPNGKFVAASLSSYGSFSAVAMYTANSSTGALTSAGTFPTNHFVDGNISDEIAFSPDSTFIAQANSDSNTITIFTVDQSTGVLGPYNGSVYGTDYPVPGASGGCSSVSYSPNGNLLAVSDRNDNLFTFTLNNGVPTFAATIAPALPVTSSDTSIAFSPDSQFIALANDFDTNIYVFSVAANGTMAQVAQLSSPQFISDLVFSPRVNDPISFLSGCGAANQSGPGFIASYTVPVLSAGPSSPQNLAASRTSNVFLLQTDLINLITWSAPTSGTPVAYNIYRDATLIDLIAIVPATSPLQFYDHNRQPNVTYTYYITAVDSNGNQSPASSVSIVG